jgi:hypothetical protein
MSSSKKLDKIQKPSINECYTPSSEPYRRLLRFQRIVTIDWYCYWPTCTQHCPSHITKEISNVSNTGFFPIFRLSLFLMLCFSILLRCFITCYAVYVHKYSLYCIFLCNLWFNHSYSMSLSFYYTNVLHFFFVSFVIRTFPICITPSSCSLLSPEEDSGRSSENFYVFWPEQ